MGSPAVRKLTPACSPCKAPLDHSRAEMACTCSVFDGRATITRQYTKPGDYADLLALVDVLAVPNVCGADVMRTSNF